MLCKNILWYKYDYLNSLVLNFEVLFFKGNDFEKYCFLIFLI